MPKTVPASAFAKHFGRYKLQAQREAVAVSSRGQVTGYFVSAEEYESLLKLKAMRSSFATEELSDTEFEAISSARMDPRHAALDRLLDNE